MTFLEEIREITAEAKIKLKQEKKLIKKIKKDIKTEAKRGCRCSYTLYSPYGICNLDYVIDYFTQLGFKVTDRFSYLKPGERVMMCKW